jgi:site-specific DNA-cytosine methylase
MQAAADGGWEEGELNVDTPTVLSIASGIGSLDTGFQMAIPGSRTVCYVERDISATGVLVKAIEEKKLDDAPIWTDCKTFDGKPWRRVVDWIIGGYPCQPFSIAGNRQGHGDPRNLWPAIKRIIGEVQPGGCFFENVGGHLQNGYFDIVRPELESLGFTVSEALVNASEVGSPQKRERVFILATNNRCERGQGLGTRTDFSGDGQWEWNGETDLQSIAKSPFINGDRWPQPLVRRMDVRSTDRVDRLHLVGNSVVPNQAAYALQLLLAERFGSK